MKIYNFISNLFKGKISGEDFFLGGWASWIPPIIIMIVWSILSYLGIVIGLDQFKSNPTTFISLIQFSITILLELIGFTCYIIAISSIFIRRGNDLGWEKHLSIFLMILGFFTGGIPILFFLFMGPKDKENKFGTRNEGRFWQRIFNLKNKNIRG